MRIVVVVLLVVIFSLCCILCCALSIYNSPTHTNNHFHTYVHTLCVLKTRKPSWSLLSSKTKKEEDEDCGRGVVVGDDCDISEW
jgi:hypothetical protein